MTSVESVCPEIKDFSVKQSLSAELSAADRSRPPSASFKRRGRKKPSNFCLLHLRQLSSPPITSSASSTLFFCCVSRFSSLSHHHWHSSLRSLLCCFLGRSKCSTPCKRRRLDKPAIAPRHYPERHGLNKNPNIAETLREPTAWRRCRARGSCSKLPVYPSRDVFGRREMFPRYCRNTRQRHDRLRALLTPHFLSFIRRSDITHRGTLGSFFLVVKRSGTRHEPGFVFV